MEVVDEGEDRPFASGKAEGKIGDSISAQRWMLPECYFLLIAKIIIKMN